MRHETTRLLICGSILATAFAAGEPLRADAELVADVNTTGIAGEGFRNLDEEAAVLDDRYYVFVADDGITGREPWVLDLWTGAVERLADIHPGPAFSNPRDFVVIGSDLLFVAEDPTHGEELWTTDGTPAGTELVLDIFPGATGSNVAELYGVPGERAVFRADDGVAGAELWISDGTPDGTELVSDIQPGPTGSLPGFFAFTNATLFFRADDGTHGYELWKWNAGTTSLVADIEPGAAGSNPSNLFPIGLFTVFSACRTTEGCELWRSDGTGANTILLGDLNPTGNSYPTGFFWHPGLGRLFFNADDGVHGHELWQRLAGANTRLTDLNPGVGDADPAALGALASKLVFVADDGGAGSRLFSYDGATVSQVKSLSTAGVPGYAQQAMSWNGLVYFVEGGSSCWRTDGTAGGTVDWDCLGAPALTVGDGRIVYGDSDSGERELWSIDAAHAIVRETDFASYSSDPDSFGWLGATAFFAADDGVEGRELWVADGTTAAERIAIEPGPDGSHPGLMQPFEGEMWFVASSSTTGGELWRSDGTPGGTVPYELVAGDEGSYPTEIAVADGHLFVAADDDTLGNQLFRVAGAGSPPDVLDYGGDFGLYPEDLTPVGARLFFFAESPATGSELFTVDGTAAQPTPLEVVPGAGGPTNLGDLVAWNGAAWFVADDGVNGAQIWRSDGTTVTRVTSLTAGNVPSELAPGPGGVYFSYDEPVFGTELWRTNGTTTARVTDVAPGAEDADPGSLTLAGGRLYFTADDETTGDELWWTDGVTVAQVADLRPGSSGSFPNDLHAAAGRLVFVADDGGGEELWLADAGGAHRLPEAWPGTGASAPDDLAVHPAGNRILFSAIGPDTWREPYLVEILPFADGFESGGTGAWSATAP